MIRLDSWCPSGGGKGEVLVVEGIMNRLVTGGRRAGLVWRAASACHPADCVQVAIDNGVVLVRDSKSIETPPLEFSFDEWRVFLDGVRHSEFDVDATGELCGRNDR
jgi:hypothetical protein